MALNDPGRPRRWAAVGHSADPDSSVAGAAAARDAMTGEDPQLVIVLAAITHDLEALLAGVRSVTGDAPLVGCSTHGEIWRGGPSDGSVLVTVLGGPGFTVTIGSSEGAAGRQRDAGAEVARSVRETSTEHPHRTLLVLTDSLLRDQEEILRGMYDVLGASVPLFGGAAADRWAMDRTFQFHGDRVLSGSVVGAMINSDGPLSVSVGHGWSPAGNPMVVTRCEDGRVYTLDDEPAMDVYLRRLDAPELPYSDVHAFKKFALTRPIGVGRRSGTEVRNLSTEVDMEGRSVGGGGHIPQGALTWIMHGDEESILDAAGRACREAIDGLGGEPAITLLTFSCSALRAAIGRAGTIREGARLSEAAGDVPFAGFYTCGEIARTHGIDGFHNQTLVVLAIA